MNLLKKDVEEKVSVLKIFISLDVWIRVIQ